MSNRITINFFCLSFVLVMIVFASTPAIGVTYRNDGTSIVMVKNKRGKQVVLPPGKTIRTYYYSKDKNLTKISDEPYWKYVKDRKMVVATPEGTPVGIDTESNYFMIFKIQTSVTVYIQAKENTPPILKNWTEDDPMMQIPIKGRCDKIVIVGNGSCEVVQFIVDDDAL